MNIEENLNTERLDYTTVNVTITDGVASAEQDVRVPDGEVVGISAVSSIAPGEILNLGLYANNQELLKPADVRFSEKTNGGKWRDSIRPVSGILGGGTITARLIALKPDRVSPITVQVLLVVKKP